MRKDVHLRINNDLYSKISDLSTLHKTTINDEIASLLELSFKINDNDKRITELYNIKELIEKEKLIIKNNYLFIPQITRFYTTFFVIYFQKFPRQQLRPAS